MSAAATNKNLVIDWEDFEKVDIRVGKIISVDEFPEARSPAYVLEIDFGSTIGLKKSSAQLPANYLEQELLGTLVAAVVNFKPKQIGPMMSEVLVLGFPNNDGSAIVVQPSKDVPLGGKLF